MPQCRHNHDLSADGSMYTNPRNGKSQCVACRREGMANSRRARKGRPLKFDRSVLDRPNAVVYFVTDGIGHVKIGTANTIQQADQRLRELQVGNACELTLVTTVPGSYDLELGLHTKFADLRIRGEWFRYEAPIKDWVEQHA